jgi:nitrite reductase/ring-hydroxylating ferredoxin subunit
MNAGPTQFKCCPSSALTHGSHRKVKIIFEGREEECLLVRFNGLCYAYINRCVHMPRPLDCEKDLVFDRSGQYLRCSMHGIVYSPETGTSVSTMCNGERLKSVRVYEADGEIGIADYRVTSLA